MALSCIGRVFSVLHCRFLLEEFPFQFEFKNIWKINWNSLDFMTIYEDVHQIWIFTIRWIRLKKISVKNICQFRGFFVGSQIFIYAKCIFEILFRALGLKEKNWLLLNNSSNNNNNKNKNKIIIILLTVKITGRQNDSNSQRVAFLHCRTG